MAGGNGGLHDDSTTNVQPVTIRNDAASDSVGDMSTPMAPQDEMKRF